MKRLLKAAHEVYAEKARKTLVERIMWVSMFVGILGFVWTKGQTW